MEKLNTSFVGGSLKKKEKSINKTIRKMFSKAEKNGVMDSLKLIG